MPNSNPNKFLQISKLEKLEKNINSKKKYKLILNNKSKSPFRPIP